MSKAKNVRSLQKVIDKQNKAITELEDKIASLEMHRDARFAKFEDENRKLHIVGRALITAMKRMRKVRHDEPSLNSPLEEELSYELECLREGRWLPDFKRLMDYLEAHYIEAEGFGEAVSLHQSLEDLWEKIQQQWWGGEIEGLTTLWEYLTDENEND